MYRKHNDTGQAMIPRTLYSLVAAAGLAVAAVAPAPVQAQGADISFGLMRQDTGLPVEITAETLEIDRAAGRVEFTGEVVVVQGELRLTAERVRALYAVAAGEADRLEQVQAAGSVVLTNAGGAAEADEAVYLLDEGRVVMSGNVMVVDQGLTLAGDRFVLDLEAGRGRVEGRVRTILGGDGATAGQGR